MKFTKDSATFWVTVLNAYMHRLDRVESMEEVLEIDRAVQKCEQNLLRIRGNISPSTVGGCEVVKVGKLMKGEDYV